MPQIYGKVQLVNPSTNEQLRTPQHKLPDYLSIDNGLVEATYCAWVSCPDWFGNEKARAIVEKTLAKIGAFNVEVVAT